ncbi:MAG: hypothetical protein P4M11_10340 [Candidatus Pacebacteria bacterium]|nr:hypothetical protein [Candidatus Paceibacterota bacterium]
MEQLKSLSKEVDIKVSKMKKVMLAPRENQEELLDSKLECAHKQLRTCEKEAERLRAAVDTKTGYDRIVEFEVRYAAVLQTQSELQKKAVALNKLTKTLASSLTRAELKQDEDVLQAQVRRSGTRFSHRRLAC